MTRQVKLWLGLLLSLLTLLAACGPAPLQETPAPAPPVEPEDEDSGRVEQDVQGAPSGQDEEPTPGDVTITPVEESAPESEATPGGTVIPDEIEMTPQTPESARDTAFSPKLESRLVQLITILQSDGLGPASDMAAALGIQLRGDSALVTILAASAEQVDAVVAAVEAVGGTVDGTLDALVQAWVPLSRLNDLASMPEVLGIQAAQSAAPAGGQPAP